MYTDVTYTLHVETYSHEKEISKILGVRRIDKRDYDQMKEVEKEFSNKFGEELDNAAENNRGLIKIDTTFLNIKEIKKLYVTYEPKDF